MHATTCFANALGQVSFECGVNVFILETDLPLVRLEVGEKLIKTVNNSLTMSRLEQPLLKKHLGVRDACAHIVSYQSGIQHVIFTCRVAQYALV